MSQSPVDDFSPVATARYQQGWKALNRLLHENRSFSGRERHCVFLNTGDSHEGGGRFANISAVSGLDFPEDGRAVAACDWDFDGRLDLWFTNRTAPRVRFLRNQNKTGYHFLAIRLQADGVRTNRDAIGARVEVWTADTGQKATRPLIKTLYAGDAFLSQSSSWLHFGLGEATEIREVQVHWPGGETQRLSGLDVDRHYVIDQLTGRATRLEPADRTKAAGGRRARRRRLRRQGAHRAPNATVAAGRSFARTCGAPERAAYETDGSLPLVRDLCPMFDGAEGACAPRRSTKAARLGCRGNQSRPVGRSRAR